MGPQDVVEPLLDILDMQKESAWDSNLSDPVSKWKWTCENSHALASMSCLVRGSLELVGEMGM